MNKYTSAQLLIQNARKIPKSRHLSPGKIFSVAIYSVPSLYRQYSQPLIAPGLARYPDPADARNEDAYCKQDWPGGGLNTAASPGAQSTGVEAERTPPIQ